MIFWILLVAAVLGSSILWLLRRSRPICTLTVREGSGTGVEFPIRSRQATIGSEEEQTVVVSHPRVSGLHAVLSLESDGRIVLRDRSRRGTKVNGSEVSETILHSGDLIRLADSIDLIFTRPG